MEAFNISVISDLLKADPEIQESGIVIKRITTEYRKNDVIFDLLINADVHDVNANFLFEMKHGVKSVESELEIMRTSLRHLSLDRVFPYLLILDSNDEARAGGNNMQESEIGVLRLSDLQEDDWGNRIKTINIQMDMIIPSYNNVEFVFDVDKIRKMMKEKGMTEFSFSFSGESDKLRVLDDKGEAKTDLKSIFEFKEKSIRQEEIGTDPVPQTYEFDTPAFVSSEIGLLPLKGVKYVRTQTKITHPILIDASNDESRVITMRIIKELKRFGGESLKTKAMTN